MLCECARYFFPCVAILPELTGIFFTRPSCECILKAVGKNSSGPACSETVICSCGGEKLYYYCNQVEHEMIAYDRQRMHK